MFQWLTKYCFVTCIAVLLFACSENDKPVEINLTEQSELQDTFYLISISGDTIPTGQFVEVLKPAQDLSEHTESFEKQENQNNIITEHRPKASNAYEVVVNRQNPFYPDSTRSEWLWEQENDTIKHPEPIQTQGTKIRLKHTNRKKLLPPEYKENAISDLQIISTDQGLLSSNIYDLLIDKRGITWVATDRGLIRYDGVFVMNFTKQEGLPSNAINCLEEGVNGEIWMGFAAGGFAKYEGEFLTVFDNKSCGFSRQVLDLKVNNDGLLFIGSLGWGLCTYDGEEIRIYDKSYGILSHKSVDSFSEDSEGNIWFINFGAGIWKYSDESLKSYSVKSGLKNNWIASVFIDTKDRIWCGTADSEAILVENGEVKVISPKGARSSYMLSFLEDNDGLIWVATSHLGVLSFEEKKITQYSIEQGLSTMSVNRLFQDAYGRIWMSTLDGGICILNNKSFQYMNSKNGLQSNRVNGVFEKDGSVYYATDEGLAIEKGDSMHWATGYGHPYLVIEESKLRTVQNMDVLLTDSDYIFTTALNFGFSRYHQNMRSMRRLGGNAGSMPQNPIAIAKDKYGVIYGTAKDLDRLWMMTDTSIYQWSFKHNYAFSNSVDMDIDAQNRVWLASKGQGVGVFDSTNWYYYTTNEGLSSNKIRDIYIDDADRVWVATADGLDFIENNQIQHVVFDNGKHATKIQSIIQDREGGYWFGLYDNLLHLIPLTEAKEWDINNYRLEVIQKNDGLISSSFLPDAMYEAEDGRLFMGTERGLLIKSPKVFGQAGKAKPNAALLSIDINAQDIDFSRVGEGNYLSSKNLPEELAGQSIVPYYNYPASLTLPDGYNHITFNYEGTYHGENSALGLEYEYYVEGIDEGWILGPEEQKADYRNLPYGEFTFHLRCFVDPENPSDEFTYSFAILPPWYQTWWARILFLLGIGLVISFVFQMRTRALRSRQKELEQTVEERTSELKVKHQQLEESHQEIKDSIAYAKRIQSAILPPRKLVKEYLPQNFVLYLPKDIVAGDFYWLAHHDDKVLFAAADCTGHGVPGAMVSVVCNNGLNRSVNEFGFSDPGKILDKTRDLVINEFEKSEDEVKDGMDIALCSLEGNHLKYAGANNPLWIIRKDADEIEEIKADKQPIGKFRDPKPFITHDVELRTGDTFYIFSDGFSDQFGGEKGKKFKTRNFKNLLLTIQDMDMDEQLKRIDQAFNEWKQDFEQVDDVCVIGVRF